MKEKIIILLTFMIAVCGFYISYKIGEQTAKFTCTDTLKTLTNQWLVSKIDL
jgi:hypothetical protein